MAFNIKLMKACKKKKSVIYGLFYDAMGGECDTYGGEESWIQAFGG